MAAPSTTAQTERTSNLFILALQNEYSVSLRQALEACKPYDALLVPYEARLEELELSSRSFNVAFLHAHLIRRSRHRNDFITISGKKGRFSDDFLTVTVHDVERQVLLRLTQIEGLPDIFIISDLACPPDVLKEAGDAAAPMRRYSDLAEPSSRASSANVSGGSLKEFQTIMSDKKMKPIAKAIRNFVNSGNCDPADVRKFLASTAEEMLTIDAWGAPLDSQRLREEVSEDFERYLLTKLYDGCFTRGGTGGDDASADELGVRIGRLARVLRPSDVKLSDRLTGTKGWSQALASLARVDGYRAPKDKLICLMNASAFLSSVLAKLYPNGSGASELLPAMMLCIAQANPKHVLRQVNFIRDYRNPARLNDEMRYCLTTVEGAATMLQTGTAETFGLDSGFFDDVVAGKNVSRPEAVSPARATPVFDAVAAKVMGSSKEPGQRALEIIDLPKDRIDIVTTEEQARRAEWDRNYADESKRIEEKWAAELHERQETEKVVAAQIAEWNSRVAEERNFAQVSERAENANSIARLSQWQMDLDERSQTQSRLAKSAQEIFDKRNAEAERRIAVTEGHMTNLQKILKRREAELDRRAAELDRRARDANDELSRRAQLLLEREASLQILVDRQKQEAARERKALEEVRQKTHATIAGQLEDLKAREEAFDRRVAAWESIFQDRQQHLSRAEDSLALSKVEEEELVESNRRAVLEEMDRRQAMITQQEQDLGKRRQEDEERHMELLEAEERFDEECKQRRLAIENFALEQKALLEARAKEVADAQRLTEQQQQLAQKEAESRNQESERQRQKAAELKAAGEATVQRSVDDVNRTLSANCEANQKLRDSLVLLRKDLERRLQEDQATQAGIQRNFTESRSMLLQREKELEQKGAEINQLALSHMTEAHGRAATTLGHCQSHFEEALAVLNDGDAAKDVNSYDNLKVSDLSKMFQTMEAMRDMRVKFTDALSRVKAHAEEHAKKPPVLPDK